LLIKDLNTVLFQLLWPCDLHAFLKSKIVHQQDKMIYKNVIYQYLDQMTKVYAIYKTSDLSVNKSVHPP